MLCLGIVTPDGSFALNSTFFPCKGSEAVNFLNWPVVEVKEVGHGQDQIPSDLPDVAAVRVVLRLQRDNVGHLLIEGENILVVVDQVGADVQVVQTGKFFKRFKLQHRIKQILAQIQVLKRIEAL